MMIPLALAVGLFFADASAVAAQQAPEAPTAEAPGADVAGAAVTPAGAPLDDYQFVAWCYGVLSGYVELHDQVMPEVTRIESTWRRPGSKLADDLKVYAVQQHQAQADLKRFHAALITAEKASVRPINELGAKATQRGRAVWNAGPEITKARLAQEWMSWTLPARCPATAATLTTRASLLGASLQANAEPGTAADPAPPVDASAARAPSNASDKN